MQHEKLLFFKREWEDKADVVLHVHGEALPSDDEAEPETTALATLCYPSCSTPISTTVNGTLVRSRKLIKAMTEYKS